MLNGVMLLWFILTVPSFLFVSIDIWRHTPEDKVLKIAFMILTLFTGPLGAFFYVLGCREPLPGTHEEYVATRWRQVLGSTMHCAAGDGVGIIVGAAIGAVLMLSFWPGFALEYLLGFGFGWAFFQAFAMRQMAGGSYRRSLRMTFLPELLSMNLLMAGMKVTETYGMAAWPHADDPATPTFWFVMSMALIVGFVCAYPMNWWLVSRHMKHGMLTVRPEPAAQPAMAGSMAGMTQSGTGGSGDSAMESMAGMDSMGHGAPDATSATAEAAESGSPSRALLAGMTVLSFAILALGLAVASAVASAHPM